MLDDGCVMNRQQAIIENIGNSVQWQISSMPQELCTEFSFCCGLVSLDFTHSLQHYFIVIGAIIWHMEDDCPNASEVTLKQRSKEIKWIHKALNLKSEDYI